MNDKRSAKPDSPSPATTAVSELYRPTQSGEVRQVRRSRNRGLVKVVSIDRLRRRVPPPVMLLNCGTEPLAWCHSRVECLQCREFYYPSQAEIVGCAGNKIPGFLCAICKASVRIAK